MICGWAAAAAAAWDCFNSDAQAKGKTSADQEWMENERQRQLKLDEDARSLTRQLRYGAFLFFALVASVAYAFGQHFGIF